ncbi:MAG: right-handed parallel beta-helix repeat-containing protein [Lentisphaerae bacterium]|nr:right-handed parallel beta-helix repeat-containing protein [Lentisphaerota bacterium]
MSEPRVFTVAIDGDDNNPGTEQQPFATLHRARDAARAARAKHACPVTVQVRGGTHYLAEPLVIAPEDSGTADAPIRYEACPGEQPTLSGAVKLELEWVPFRDGILKADLGDRTDRSDRSDLSELLPLPFDQLFVNGVRKHRARYPGYDPENPTRSGKGLCPTGEQFGGDPATELEFYPHPESFNPTVAKWEHPEEAFVHVSWFYGTCIHQLRGIDYERNRFLLGRGGWHWNTRVFQGAQGMHFSRCFVDNVFEELNTPGEWYFNPRENALYYMPETGDAAGIRSQPGSRLSTVSPSNCPTNHAPPPLEGETVASRSPAEGEDMATALIEVPHLQQLVVFRGKQDDPVRNVTFSGFQFTHSTTVFMEPWEAVSMGDWAIHRSGAAFMEGTEECGVENSVFHATGGNAVMISGYNVRSRVAGCTFTETGESAVCLVGDHMKRLGTARPFPDECVVTNNHMFHLGEYQAQVAGVFLACCQKIEVSHNDIHDVPRAAILMHDPTWGGHVIEYNRMYRTCMDSVDHGPFNSWGRTRHWCFNQSHGPDFPSHPAGNVEDDALHLTELRYNYLEDLNSNFGVDQDDGTCRIRIHHNVLVGCPIKFRETTDSVAENNIIIDSTLGTRSDTAYEYNTNKFLRNIMVCRKDMHIGPGYGLEPEEFRRHFYHAMVCPAKGPILQEIDHNVFWSDLGEFRACVSSSSSRGGTDGESEALSLEEWQAKGYDAHSVFADPMFVDEANGDYRLKPESPALKLGFESFSMDECGLLSDFPGPSPEEVESKYGPAGDWPGANP